MAKVEQEITIKVTMDQPMATDAREWDWTDLIGDETVIVSAKAPVILPDPDRFQVFVQYKGMSNFTEIWENGAKGEAQDVANWLSNSMENILGVRGGIEAIKIEKIS